MKMMPIRHLLYTIRSLPLAIYLSATLADNLANLSYAIKMKYACKITAIGSRQIIKPSLQGDPSVVQQTKVSSGASPTTANAEIELKFSAELKKSSPGASNRLLVG